MNGTVVVVSECKHTWRIYKDGINCLKCTISIVNVLANREKENADLRVKLEVFKEYQEISRGLEKELYAEKLVLQGAKDTLRDIVNERDDLSAKIGQLDKYAELGRLVLNGNPCCFGYEYADGDCVSVVCSDNEKKVCKKRSELLAEGGE